MKGGEISALIIGLLTFLGSLYGTWRAARSDRYKSNSDNAAILLGGWRDFQAETRNEVERVRTTCQEQIEAMKKEHNQDRQEWEDEKAAMVDAWAKEKAAMNAEIETLKSQVFILLEKQTRSGP